VGNHIGAYEEGDVYFFGRSLPHGFRKQNPQMHGDALVVQFKEEIFGRDFIHLPEMAKIHQIMYNARRGIKLKGGLKAEFKAHLQFIESQTSFQRLRMLLDCLHLISISEEITFLSDEPHFAFSKGDQDRIGLVYVWRCTSADNQSLVNSDVMEKYLFDPAKRAFFHLVITTTL
jgi:hypothetical protein